MVLTYALNYSLTVFFRIRIRNRIRIRKSFKYVYTHKEFDLMTGASSAEESTDIVLTYMIVQTYKSSSIVNFIVYTVYN